MFGLRRRKVDKSCATLTVPPTRSCGISTGTVVSGLFSSPLRNDENSVDGSWKDSNDDKTLWI